MTVTYSNSEIALTYAKCDCNLITLPGTYYTSIISGAFCIIIRLNLYTL